GAARSRLYSLPCGCLAFAEPRRLLAAVVAAVRDYLLAAHSFFHRNLSIAFYAPDAIGRLPVARASDRELVQPQYGSLVENADMVAGGRTAHLVALHVGGIDCAVDEVEIILAGRLAAVRREHAKQAVFFEDRLD